MILAAEHFRRVRALEHSKAQEKHKWFIAAKQEKARKEEQAEKLDEAMFEAAVSTIMADPVEIEAFRMELDAYDEATVKALMQNREILEQLFIEREAMLAEAYQLEDGTRVFKSEDGKTVINEHGEFLSLDQIDPNEISDHLTTSEEYMALNNKIDHHIAIEQQLLDYQEKLDDARERLNAGDMTKEEFDQTRQELKSDMPIQARQQLSDEHKVSNIDLQKEFKPAADDLPTASRSYTAMPDFAMN